MSPAKKTTKSKSATTKRAFDFPALEGTIESAVRRAFSDFVRAHPNDPPCAFALYSDQGAMTVCPAFDLASRRDARVAEHPDDADYYTFGTPEWAFEGFGADDEFEAICTVVRTHVLKIEDTEDTFSAFKKELFETCIRVLEKFRAAGAFATYPNLLVMFAVSDDGDLDAKSEVRMMKRLNGDSSPWVKRYRRWTKSWAEG